MICSSCCAVHSKRSLLTEEASTVNVISRLDVWGCLKERSGPLMRVAEDSCIFASVDYSGMLLY